MGPKDGDPQIEWAEDEKNPISNGVRVTTAWGAKEVWEQFWSGDKNQGLAHITTRTV